MAVVLVVVLVVLVVAGVLVARRAAGSARGRIDDRLAGLDVVRRDKANFYGLASAGAGQVRGLGVLALTPTEVVFLQLVPDREVRVPRASITSVSTDRSWLGKTQGRELLVLAWTAGDGSESAAWDVPDLAAWQAELA